jgi:hypothetical protein
MVPSPAGIQRRRSESSSVTWKHHLSKSIILCETGKASGVYSRWSDRSGCSFVIVLRAYIQSLTVCDRDIMDGHSEGLATMYHVFFADGDPDHWNLPEDYSWETSSWWIPSVSAQSIVAIALVSSQWTSSSSALKRRAVRSGYCSTQRNLWL